MPVSRPVSQPFSIGYSLHVSRIAELQSASTFRPLEEEEAADLSQGKAWLFGETEGGSQGMTQEEADEVDLAVEEHSRLYPLEPITAQEMQDVLQEIDEYLLDQEGS